MGLTGRFEKQPNGYLKFIDDGKTDQLDLFVDYQRYSYSCLDCGFTFKNTYPTHTQCIRCKSENIIKKSCNI